MEAHVATNAEWDEVTADTGRLFGPVLASIPFFGGVYARLRGENS
jgi:hypothetical protein